MFRRLLSLVISINFMSGLALNTVACNWDLNPNVLLVTSYNYAEKQISLDQIIYHKLQQMYGTRAVAAIFDNKDDNSYAIALRNLIERYHLQKIYFLDPSFASYLPSTTQNPTKTSNLIRLFQQYTNVQFYFFNNQIANSIKVSSNIFEFRLNTGNVANPYPTYSYGQLIAQHFYKQLIKTDGSELVNAQKYNFEVDGSGKWIIRIGIINNIGDQYEQDIINQFLNALASPTYTPKDARYVYYSLNVINPNLNYNEKNINLVTQAAINLYLNDKVNFILNTNSWYNNAIDYAASYVDHLPGYSKTISFIGSNIIDNKTFWVNNRDYLLFAYNVKWDFLEDTQTGVIPDQLKVVANAPEKDNAYGINNNLYCTNGF